MSADARPLRAVDDDGPRERRFFHEDGRPNHAELAYSALMQMHGSPVREEAAKWARSATVNAILASREEMQVLAMANRELAQAHLRLADAMNRVADQWERGR